MTATLLQDVRFAARTFLRSPRFTIPAVLALALGIGATSAIFSVVRGVMLKPLPYPDPDRIVVVWENNLRRNRPRNVVGAANFVEWRERNRSFDHLGMVGPSRINVILNGQPEEVAGLRFPLTRLRRWEFSRPWAGCTPLRKIWKATIA